MVYPKYLILQVGLLLALLTSPHISAADAVRLAPDCRPYWKSYVEQVIPNITRATLNTDDEAVALQKRLMRLWSQQVRANYGPAFASKDRPAWS